MREKFIKKFGEKNKEKISDQYSERFFKSVEAEKKSNANIIFYLNTDIWNNRNIYKLTGYSIEDLLESLIALSKFVSDNLVPNKLKYFDLEAIKDLKITPEVQKAMILENHQNQKHQE